MNIVPMKVELIDSMGSDLSVVNAARVSFHKESDWEYLEESLLTGQPTDKKLNEKDQKLISYLAKHGHWTPFAHAFLSFRIKAPIFVARQLVKHQVGLAWNEVSRRYVDDEPEFWEPQIWRKRAENVKQGSSDEAVPVALDDIVYSYDGGIENYLTAAIKTYNYLLNEGVAPEQARMVLPQNTMTEWLWSGSLAAFARVVKLRTDPHAQKETQEIAFAIDSAVPNSFQHSWKALTA
jgi:thymidylate synthase (FAD)